MAPQLCNRLHSSLRFLYPPPAMAYLVATKVLCQDGHKDGRQRVRVELRMTKCVEMK